MYMCLCVCVYLFFSKRETTFPGSVNKYYIIKHFRLYVMDMFYLICLIQTQMWRKATSCFSSKMGNVLLEIHGGPTCWNQSNRLLFSHLKCFFGSTWVCFS